eukprot:5161982-Prymnesium_polylepis.1
MLRRAGRRCRVSWSSRSALRGSAPRATPAAARRRPRPHWPARGPARGRATAAARHCSSSALLWRPSASSRPSPRRR